MYQIREDGPLTFICQILLNKPKNVAIWSTYLGTFRFSSAEAMYTWHFPYTICSNWQLHQTVTKLTTCARLISRVPDPCRPWSISWSALTTFSVSFRSFSSFNVCTCSEAPTSCPSIVNMPSYKWLTQQRLVQSKFLQEAVFLNLASPRSQHQWKAYGGP